MSSSRGDERVNDNSPLPGTAVRDVYQPGGWRRTNIYARKMKAEKTKLKPSGGRAGKNDSKQANPNLRSYASAIDLTTT